MTQIQELTALPRSAPAQPSRRGSILGRALRALVDWQQRAREYQQLSRLTDYELKDIGITRADVERIVHRGFWLLQPAPAPVGGTEC